MMKTISPYQHEGGRLLPTLYAFLALFIVFHHGNTDALAAGRKPGQEKTIAHVILEMEKPLGAGESHRIYLDGFLARARETIKAGPLSDVGEAAGILGAIHSFLQGEGFRFKANYLLFQGIDRKSMDCDNFCALYIAIGETIGIPLVPVYAPNHSFIRLYFEDGSYMNWEATEGKSLPDSYYRQNLKIEESSLRQGVYMKTLSRKEFIGVEYNNMGAYMMTTGMFRDAIPLFNSAIGLYPSFSSAYHNRGSSRYATGGLDDALKDLLIAKRLDPGRSSTRNTLGDIYFDRKKYDLAIEEYLESIRLDPCHYVPYRSLGQIMKIRGDESGALEWMRKSEEAKKKNCY
ncbi:MAG: tetratricopeptide repeat protein [Chrysiogenales bacterium]|nr:MAG: tetratricopeptide repeat protein [Chrysiogenales bacterium]